MGQLLILDVTYIMYEAIDTIQAALTEQKSLLSPIVT